MAVVTSSLPGPLQHGIAESGSLKNTLSASHAQELGLEKKQPDIWLTAARERPACAPGLHDFDDSIAACRGARRAKSGWWAL